MVSSYEVFKYNQLRELDLSGNTRITSLGTANMPMLTRVRVWTLPFPPEGVNVLMAYSPCVEFVLD